MLSQRSNLLSFRSSKFVRIPDKRLGAFHWLLRMSVVGYTIVWVCFISGGYLDTEHTAGVISTMVQGSTFSPLKEGYQVWDEADAVVNGLDHGGLFITTQVVTTEQKQGNCSNPLAPCKREEDCEKLPPLKSGDCNNSTNQCIEMLWCPPQDPAESDDDSEDEKKDKEKNSVIHVLDGTDDFEITFLASLKLRMNSTVTLTTIDEPEENTFELEEILEEADLEYEDINESGCVLNVELKWNCEKFWELDECMPDVDVLRLDADGFSMSSALYSGFGEKQTRMLYNRTGVRMYVSAKGRAQVFSLFRVVFHVAVTVMLLQVASWVTDFIMITLLPERRHYMDYKYDSEYCYKCLDNSDYY